MTFETSKKRGKNRIKAERARLFTEFYIWGNWLKNNHFTLDNHPFNSRNFEVRRIQANDALYMAVFVNSQITQRVVAEQIKSMFREAEQPEPVFVTMRKFLALHKETYPGLI